MLPESALTKVPASRLEEFRTRISALLCTNIDGSHRLAPWYIGRNPNPHAFRSAEGHIQSLGMVWRHNPPAKVTRSIFREFLRWLDNILGGRKIVLLLNAPPMQRFVFFDSQPPDLRNFGLKNITIIYPSPSWMDTYNQLRTEVVGTWKTFYRIYWLQYVYDQLNAHRNPLTTMNILKAVSWACRAWHTDIDRQSLQNCSRRVGWRGIPAGDNAEDEEEYKTMKQHLRDILEKLEQIGFLREAMDVDTLISPPFESSEGAWIEETTAAQASSVEVLEGDSDEEIINNCIDNSNIRS